ncbi:NAD(P)-binding Rossmann-fold containing protein [Glarea lozoyensis ATCC 20868]|uniref:NAD(P)-binding Rossmann-fold containing protein n=1 Tax=Glarea lozoyensis (strain ATCC 20868 / MF5171) TaxID=1116229 RepID=S3D4Z1_GLAL2|nr:NAD(P)-binding Rossmann-fold containing protein [Glarea lozoyensis ATCC 20868]EPE32164.1 NAD(P)-binding Rossmann-fold containing protein [Glarea lozoyensis ATCC 20868]
MALNATLLLLNATMRAVVWSGIPFNVTVQNVPVPTIQAATDARVRITAAAICGTDMHTYHGTYGSDSAPWIMGHEAVGIIESIGSAVQNIQVGDHVVIPDSFDLGELNMALAEPWANDGAAPGLGLDYGEFYGCQAEYIVVPFADHSLWHIPSNGAVNTSREIDYLFTSDIFATGWSGVSYSGFVPGDSVAIFGAGPVGLLAAHSAIIRGASRVYVVDHVEQRLELAESFGAIPINFNGTNGTAVEQIMRLEPDGVTRSVDCVGYEAVNKINERQSNLIIMDMVAVTSSRGGISSVGVYTHNGATAGTPLGNTTTPNVEFPIVNFFEKGLTYRAGPVDVKLNAPQLTHLIETGVANPALIVSSFIDIEQAPEYYRRFSDHLETKIVIRFP